MRTFHTVFRLNKIKPERTEFRVLWTLHRSNKILLASQWRTIIGSLKIRAKQSRSSPKNTIRKHKKDREAGSHDKMLEPNIFPSGPPTQSIST